MGCGSPPKTETPIDNQNQIIDNRTGTLQDSLNEINENVIERYFPEELGSVKIDTIITERDLTITIQSRFLDSYVINEFEIDGIKYVDKYRESEKHLLIKSSTEILADTVFSKDDFNRLLGDDLRKIARFHGYWLDNINNETIVFVGVFNKPETDISVAFNHYFDLKTNTFRIEELIEDEI